MLISVVYGTKNVHFLVVHRIDNINLKYLLLIVEAIP